MKDELQLITTILAVSMAIWGVIYGFLIYRLSTVFESKSTAEDYKERNESDKLAMRTDVKELTKDIRSLLEAIASIRGERKH